MRTVMGTLPEETEEIISNAKRELARLEAEYRAKAEPFVRLIVEAESMRPPRGLILETDEEIAAVRSRL